MTQEGIALLSERFLRHVQKTDGCWLWTGSRSSGKYGSFRVSGRSLRAHRVAWLLNTGVMPEQDVLHRCDNHHWDKRYMSQYLREFDFRYNVRRTTDAERATIALKATAGKRLMLREPKASRLPE